MKRLCLLLALLVPVLARAQATVDLTQLGKQEFEAGQKEFNLGHFEKALEHFESSYRLTNRPALLFNLGYVLKQLFERTRKIEYAEKAIDRFGAYLKETRGADDPQSVKQRERVEHELAAVTDELAKERAARAQGEETLQLGEELLAKGKIAEARAQLERFEKSPGNERSGVARSLVLRGGILIAEGDTPGAIEAYGRALSLDRSVAQPADAPEVAKNAFSEAQKRVGPVPPVGALHTPPGSVKPGAPLELSFTLASDPMHVVAGLQLFYRAGSGAFSSLPLQPVGKVALPRVFTGALLPGVHIEYFANVVDANGAILQHLGSVALPYAVQVEMPRPPGIAKKGWFWGVMAGVAAVAATGIALGVYYSQPAPATRVPVNLGVTVRVP
jgi:tetratricopeptide (TPR) repeat protein